MAHQSIPITEEVMADDDARSEEHTNGEGNKKIRQNLLGIISVRVSDFGNGGLRLWFGSVSIFSYSMDMGPFIPFYY